MKHIHTLLMKNKLPAILLLLTLAAVAHIPASAAPGYREKYRNVLEHYSRETSDSLKYKAALYLIDNMNGHCSPEGAAMDSYIRRIHTMKKAKGIRELQEAWHASLREGSVGLTPDSTVVTDAFLIKDIDNAFLSWQQSQWKDSVTFSLFCRYILPYRVNEEHFGRNWREPLREQYGAVIDGVTDIRKAFALVRDTVFKVIALSNAYCEYDLDPMTCNTVGRAECSQRCVLLVAVLRALGIPAVIDGTPMWADYSNKGHAWVAMVMANGNTYTVFEKDKEAKLLNPVDASQFLPRYKTWEKDGFPYTVKTEKTPVKIYRMCYDHCNKVGKYDAMGLGSPFIMDVSGEYGLTTDVTITTDCTADIYLCAYMSGRDWMPVAKAKAAGGSVTFKNVGKGSVCVPIAVIDGKKKVLSCPFLVGSKGVERRFTPVPAKSRTITIDRKYPLCSYTTDTWAAMRGAVFEGSMTEDFAVTDTLAVITDVPSYMTTLSVSSPKRYRFLRYHAPQLNRSSLAELQFYASDDAGGTRLLTGTPFAKGVDMPNIGKVFDGNPATICRGMNTGYTIGLDLGEGNGQRVAKITFSPSTDLNFVEKRHLYELYYFDTEWQMIGREYARQDKLTFSNVPENAILLLKDRSGGMEERIFEYEDGKQIWH